jgi:hypothetical protein
MRRETAKKLTIAPRHGKSMRGMLTATDNMNPTANEK